LWSKSVYSIVLLKNFITIDGSCSLFICLSVQISIPYRGMGTASTLYTYFWRFWTKVGLKVLFVPVSEKILIVFVESFLIFIWHFTTKIYTILHICYTQWSYILLGLVLKMSWSQIFSGDIYIPKSFAIFYNLNTPLCKLSSVSVIMTWSSAKQSFYSCSDS